MPYYLRLDPPVNPSMILRAMSMSNGPGDDDSGGSRRKQEEEFKGSSNVYMTADTPPALGLQIG